MPLPVKFINTHDSINKKFPPMFELKKGLTFESLYYHGVHLPLVLKVFFNRHVVKVIK